MNISYVLREQINYDETEEVEERETLTVEKNYAAERGSLTTFSGS